jgi:tryptophan synthase beta chain
LDYAGVGPEHAALKDSGRARYVAVRDAHALRAFHWLCEDEGIIPALEPSHALFAALREARRRPARERIVVTLSGRGDKDLEVVNHAA